jgi:signal recognition particle subunit SRP54
MALSALGGKISAALGSLMRTESVDDEAIDAALKEICNALMEADVNLKLVMQLRKNVKARISSDAGPAVFDKVSRPHTHAHMPQSNLLCRSSFLLGEAC